MQHEPFQSFDAGWILLGAMFLAATVWLLIDIRRTGIPLQDEDDDWDVEPRRHDPESDARRRPF